MRAFAASLFVLTLVGCADPVDPPPAPTPRDRSAIAARAGALEEVLRGPARPTTAHDLWLYLHVTGPAEPDQPALDAASARRVAASLGGVHPREVYEWVEARRAGRVPPLARDAALVASARAALRAYTERATVERLVEECEARYRPLTIGALEADADGWIVAEREVQPGFRLACARDVVGPFLRGAPEWVVGPSTMDERARAELSAAYWRGYRQEWVGFVRGLRIRPAFGANEEAARLDALTAGEPTALGRVFWVVDVETRADRPGREGLDARHLEPAFRGFTTMRGRDLERWETQLRRVHEAPPSERARAATEASRVLDEILDRRDRDAVVEIDGERVVASWRPELERLLRPPLDP